MILDVFVIAFLLALITKNIKCILNRNYKFLYLFPVPIVFQLFRNYYLMIFSFAFLTFLCFVNKEIPGFKAIGIGTVLNGLVMSLNSGKMPAYEPFVKSLELHVGSRHIIFEKFSITNIFGDYIPIILPWSRKFLISPGDIFIYIGVFLLFLSKKKC